MADPIDQTADRMEVEEAANIAEICRKAAIPEKNCRSCKAANPVENGEWFCEVHNGVIPGDFIATGCDSYSPITAVAKNV